jgi:outer membrane protein assembly factor BamB
MHKRGHLWKQRYFLLASMFLFSLMGLAACGGQVNNPDQCSAVPPSGYPALVMSNGNIYLPGDYADSLYAVRMSDGALQWKYHTGRLFGVDNGIVYTQGLGDILYALRATDGKQLWHYDMGPDVSGVDAVMDGLVYLSSSNTLTMYTLRGSDGKRIWQHKIDVNHFPIHFAANNGIVYVASDYDRILALRESDGSQLWQYDSGIEPPGNTLSMTLSDGIVYAAQNQTVALRASDGTLLWSFPKAGALVAGQGFVSIAADQLYTLRSSDGKVLWSGALPPLSNQKYVLMLADGVLYVGPQWRGGVYTAVLYSDHLYAFNATNGTLLWDRQFPTSSLVSLSVFNGIAYLLSAGTLNAVQVSDGKLLWHKALQQVGVAVINGVIYAGTSGNADSCFPLTNSRLAALRASDGTQLWNFESGSVTDPSLP